MKCPHCNRIIQTKYKLAKKTMTREQFEKLKKGSIIKSRGNRKRYVMMKSNNGYIRLRKLSYDRGYPHDYVGYLYSDICRGYKIVKY